MDLCIRSRITDRQSLLLVLHGALVLLPLGNHGFKHAEEETYATGTASTAIAVTGVRAARARTHLVRRGIGNVL